MFKMLRRSMDCRFAGPELLIVALSAALRKGSLFPCDPLPNLDVI
jgi:hypothetical protein